MNEHSEILLILEREKKKRNHLNFHCAFLNRNKKYIQPRIMTLENEKNLQHSTTN